MVYPKALEAFKKSVKVARREVDDEEVLAKLLSHYLDIEKLLSDGNKSSQEK